MVPSEVGRHHVTNYMVIADARYGFVGHFFAATGGQVSIDTLLAASVFASGAPANELVGRIRGATPLQHRFGEYRVSNARVGLEQLRSTVRNSLPRTSTPYFREYPSGFAVGVADHSHSVVRYSHDGTTLSLTVWSESAPYGRERIKMLKRTIETD